MSKKSKEIQLPVSRIKMIMKSSPDCESIGQDSLFLVSKCTEMFIQYISLEGLAKSKKNSLEYKGIADFVQSKPSLNFLSEILPQKLTVKECLKIIAETENSGSFSTMDDSSEDEEKPENWNAFIM